MIRKIWVINLALAVAVVILFSMAFSAWQKSSLVLDNAAVKDTTVDNNVPKLEKTNLSENKYNVIVNNNLFSPDRTVPEKKATVEIKQKKQVEEESTPPNIKKNYILFGTIFKPGDARALVRAPVEDKEADPVRWVSEGEKLADFTVSEILNDKLYIENNTARYTISLYTETETRAAETQADGRASSTQTQRITGTSSTKTDNQTPEREAPQVISTQNQEKTNTQNEEGKAGDVVIDGDYKIIDTPFGKSRIRIK